MIKTNLWENTLSRSIVDSKGSFSVAEYEKDISVKPEFAQIAYFSSQMEIRKRQLLANVKKDCGIITQKGSMQLILGEVVPTTNIQGAGDLVKKFIGGKVSGESAIKPKYTGEGMIILEPTYRYIILEDLSTWNGSMVVEDGMFLACEDTVDMKISSRTTASSVVFGGEGLFNLTFVGNGVVALESPAPKRELIEIELVDDVVKIDGNMAIAWSKDLKFTVERTTPTLVGSLAAGEGFVNVYRGTGKILVAPVACNRGISVPENKK